MKLYNSPDSVFMNKLRLQWIEMPGDGQCRSQNSSLILRNNGTRSTRICTKLSVLYPQFVVGKKENGDNVNRGSI